MHNYAAELLGLDYVYVSFDVHPDNLRKIFNGVRGLGIKGLNVTVPHKEKVIPFLDRVEEDASIMGAVNTITLDNGCLVGANTDGTGFIKSIAAEGLDPNGKKVAIVGAGGSARAIGVALCRAGASSITVINRSASRGKRLARHLSKLGDVSFVASDSESERVKEATYASDLIVQTTPCGMKRTDPLPAEQVAFRKGQLLCDIIYTIETPFMKKARSMGARAINGLGMLVCQGSESFRIWTGHSFPEKEILGFLKRILSKGG
ncbi:MAG: shikimate dehydrogenase (NADP(+)) [bacterium]|nr:MAG: shikimate dehydrogenase (NADP(+)) [bacterium]